MRKKGKDLSKRIRYLKRLEGGYFDLTELFMLRVPLVPIQLLPLPPSFYDLNKTGDYPCYTLNQPST